MFQQLAFGGVRTVSLCSRCKKPLSNPISMRAGMGPVCRGHTGLRGQDNEIDMRTTEFSDRNDFSKPLSEALVLRRPVDSNDPDRVGPVITNVPHLVAHHSPDGFEFGYAGSGPADLALNVCEWYLHHIGYQGEKTQCWDGECFSVAYVLHQDLKREFISPTPHEGREIPFANIDAWFKEHITKNMEAAYAVIEVEESEVPE